MYTSISHAFGRHFHLVLPVVLATLLAGAVPNPAQVHRFGKNKVQYADFQWQKTETAHFDLYFYPEEEELAAYAAAMAEEGYADLERKFAHTVQRRIPLIIYSSHVYFEQTNIIPGLLPAGVAGFTEFLKGRVVLPLSGSLPEFERVLRHELVHVFMADRIQGVLGRRGITDFRPAPLWFSEGLAEYWSGKWDSYADMIMRDALFSRRLVAIDGIHFINGTFLLYKEGQSICAHMAATYGEDIFALLLDNWWRGHDFSEVFEKVTGDAQSKLDKDWQYRLGKEYLPDIAAGDPPSRFASPLTRRGFNVKPQIVASPGDSVGVLFFRNYQGYTRIVRTSLQGGDAVVVVEGERSPSFEALHALDTKPAVSADGRRLAFSAKRAGRDHLYLWDLHQGREERRFAFEDIVAISSPSWSPDGRRLVFSGAHRGGIADLYVVDTETGTLQALTADVYHDRDPDWSADGRHIAFSSDRWEGGRRGFYNLFLYEVEKKEILPLTRGYHNDLQPSWSRSGGELVFSSDRDTMFNLYTMRLSPAAGGGLQAATRRLTRTLTGIFDPVWTPGQRGVLFSGYENGRFQIYRQELRPDSAAVAWNSLPAPEAGSWTPSAGQSGPLAMKKYKKKMDLDIAQSQISQDLDFGTSGGIQVGMSDMLGNDHYYFVLSHLSGNVDVLNGFNMVLGRQHLQRQLNTTWGVFRLNDRFSGRFGRRVREKRVGANIDLSYPFSKFDRVETSLALRHASIDRQSAGRRLKGWLITNALSYTHDSSLWTLTGPLEGKRYSLGIAQTVDFKRSRRFNVTVFVDYRHYLRLSRRSALALRFIGRHSAGKVPEFFPLGGSWTLRGYGWRSIWGNKALLFNNELRFPLLDRLVIGLPLGSIDLSAFRGALFVDAGNAWTDEFGGWKGSLGAGVRLALGGIFVFRLDAARRTDFKGLGNDTHWDFFFGWDF